MIYFLRYVYLLELNIIMSEKIAFIGVGNMGLPMAKNLANAGKKVKVFDVSKEMLNKARNENIRVYSIPGASSPIAALSISGLPSEKFYFEGFLPKKKGKQGRLKYLSQMDCTIIMFESPYRIIDKNDNSESLASSSSYRQDVTCTKTQDEKKVFESKHFSFSIINHTEESPKLNL